MNIKKTTPHDLLYSYGFKATREPASGTHYIKATYVCDQCDAEKDFLLGFDETVYHECNKGNVVYRPNARGKK